MKIKTAIFIFLERQFYEFKKDFSGAFQRKIKLLIKSAHTVPIYVIAIPVVLLLRLLERWIVVRIGVLMSSRIGHFAGNTELYICEQKAGINTLNHRHIDLFYFESNALCNQQLALMWKRLLTIYPAWILRPISQMSSMLRKGDAHELGRNTQNDRDVHNLLDKYPASISFTPEEEKLGIAGLEKMGIPASAKFVCLIVRDDAYLKYYFKDIDFSYHNYRDCDIKNYVAAAESLTARNYFVVRMGAKVSVPMPTNNPMIIDYGFNGMRSDFMDIYLGAKCTFCISTGTGWDAVPVIFRRPIVYTDYVPIADIQTSSNKFLTIIKNHAWKNNGKLLTMSEIFSSELGRCFDTDGYEKKGVKLIDNSPEEIRDVVIEMANTLEGNLINDLNAKNLQRKFWKIFSHRVRDVHSTPLHGELRGKFGNSFLQKNKYFLQ